MKLTFDSYAATIDHEHNVRLTETADDVWTVRISGPEPAYSLNAYRTAEHAKAEAEIFVKHELRRKDLHLHWQVAHRAGATKIIEANPALGARAEEAKKIVFQR